MQSEYSSRKASMREFVAASGYGLIVLFWFLTVMTMKLIGSGLKPGTIPVLAFEGLSFGYFLMILAKFRHLSTLPELLFSGLRISLISVLIIPAFLLAGLAMLQILPGGVTEVPAYFAFAPTQPVVFTLLVLFSSALMASFLASGLIFLFFRQEEAQGKEFDIFFSFSKMDLGQGMPADDFLYDNLFRQIRKADELGFKRAWIGEAHFSIRTEQKKPEPLLPHFNGELCINTDILQIASIAIYQTEQIEIGSAIRNILVNGGPVAHAESVRTFLTLHQKRLKETGRKIQIGFGVGRFAYANEVYGVKPRNDAEKLLWPALRGLVLREATEIFLRMLRGEILGSVDLSPLTLKKNAVRKADDWAEALKILGLPEDTISLEFPHFWEFQPVKIIPEDCDLSCLELTIGSHDPELQEFANRFLPVRVFNLSVTPGDVIDETHVRMKKHYHISGGPWHRSYMPRTIMIFTNAGKGLHAEEQNLLAEAEAKDAMVAYWKAMEGTVDQAKVESGMENAVYGCPGKVKEMLEARFHPEDRLMTWFDFNTNDSLVVMKRMEDFMKKVKPLFHG